jgi:hypothetical protein
MTRIIVNRLRPPGRLMEAIRTFAMVAIAIGLAGVCCVNAAHANEIKIGEVEAVSALAKRGVQISGDIMETSNAVDPSSAEMVCLQELGHVSQNLYSEVLTIMTVMLLAATMDSKADEARSLVVLKKPVDLILDYAKVARGTVNNLAGTCSRSAAVNSKVGVLLGYIDDVVARAEPLRKRFGDRKWVPK